MPPTQEQVEQWRARRRHRLLNRAGIASASGPDGRSRFWYVEGELLVSAEHDQLTKRVLRGRGHSPVEVEEEPDALPGLHRYRSARLDVPSLVAELRGLERQGDAGGLRAGPNHVFSGAALGSAATGDPATGGIRMGGAPSRQGGPFGLPTPVDDPGVDLGGPRRRAGVRVNVVDTGVWIRSPLRPSRYHARPDDRLTDFDYDDDGRLDDEVGHANFIGGVVLGHTDTAAIEIVRVLDSFGICTEADLVTALYGLGDFDLLNLSLGGYSQGNEPPAALGAALAHLLEGTERVVVAAAGNDGDGENPFWPAAFAGQGEPWSDQVVAVASHDGSDLCSWSNRGDWVTLAAFGEDVTSTYVHHDGFDSGWAQWSGTSFAAPYVTAEIAARMAPGGSATAALADVRASLGDETYGGYPGLP